MKKTTIMRLVYAFIFLNVYLTATAQTSHWGTDANPPSMPALSEQQQHREMKLANELRCLVCQNQSIAESNAPLALDLRGQIREQIAAGQTDAQIMDYMTARYGDFVRYRPVFKPQTVLLWLGPALLLMGGLILAWRMAKARSQANTKHTLTEQERARAEQLLKP